MMNRRSALALAGLLYLSVSLPASDWQLVWQDEFDGPVIDLTKWNYEVNAWGGGNKELQYYTDRPVNSRIENGCLIIEAHKEDYTGEEGTREYTSARMNTKNKGDWLYGRFEIRAKLPGKQGLWPAVWMLPTDWEYGGWAASGEIDIIEHQGEKPTQLINTIHHGGEWPENIYTGNAFEGPDLTADFNLYVMEWEPEKITWYLNGEKTWEITEWQSSAAPYPAPFNRRFHLLVNLAVGGTFLEDPLPDAKYFPRRLEIDCIRVYQKPEADILPMSTEAESEIDDQ